MKEQQRIASDFEAARHQTGLRQVDCAHLLGVHRTRISRIENNHSSPNVAEAVTLAVVYGQPLEAIFTGLVDSVVADLIERLRTLPNVGAGQTESFNRAHTLSELARRLEVLSSKIHEAA